MDYISESYAFKEPKGHYVVSKGHYVLVSLCHQKLRNAIYPCQSTSWPPGNVLGRLSHAKAKREFPTRKSEHNQLREKTLTEYPRSSKEAGVEH
jgi:hypothetical protein